ncbi:MAG: Hpt domain-containing protein, partial [Gallionellaceae bacterium]|nr:Hpt domain-containing protein [Gallionellaceae bacterium]
MTDIQTLTRPTVFDAEALHEFSDALVDRAHDIERDMDKLSKDPDNKLLIADIFRSLHNIKGDAALCSVPMAALIAHPIESVVTRLRSGEVRYSRLLAEVILLGIDRLEMAVEALVAGKPVAQLKLVKLVEGLEKLSQLPQPEIDRGAVQLIKEVTGFQPQATLGAATITASIQSQSKDSMASDLRFFRSLALQFEARSKVFAGRTERIHHLALITNREAGSPVDEVQLEAAVYLHDVGMMFLPEDIWLR